MKLLYSGFDAVPQKRELERLAAKVCETVPKLKRSGEINFILVSDKTIKKLHKDYLDDGSATDVITFQYPPMRDSKSAGPDAPFGDVYISMDTARVQAKAVGHELHREIAFLMVHGLLHLAGHDDRAPHLRRKMLAFQTKLIQKIAPKLVPAAI